MFKTKQTLTFTVIFFCLSASAGSDKTAQGGDADASQESLSTAKSTTAALKASDFFQPVRQSYQRDASWPDRLEFESRLVSTQAFRRELSKHSWRVMFHCDGRPIEVAKLKSLPNGVQNPGLEFSFTEDGSMSRKTFRYQDAKPKADDELEFDDLQDSYLVMSLGKGQFRLNYKNGLQPQVFSVLRVKQTDETVLEVANENAKPVHLQKLKVCPNGELAKELYVSSADTKN